MSVSVSVSGSNISATVSGGVGPAGPAGAPSTVTVGVISLNSLAGNISLAGSGITVSQSSQTITLTGPSVPVTQVQGRTGSVTISRADVTAAASVHTHAASDIVGLAGVATSGSYTALNNVPLTFAPATHTHASTQISNSAATLPQLTATQNNLSLGSGDVIRLSSDAARTITGLLAAADGDAKLLINAGAHPITLAHQNVSSDAANRIVSVASSDYVLAADDSVPIAYDGDAARWRVLASRPTTAAVQSVAGRTGAITLTAADVAGLAGVATSGSYTALSNVPTAFPPVAHTHSTTEVQSFSVAAAAAAPVQSVAGRTGVITLSVADVANAVSNSDARLSAAGSGSRALMFLMR